MLLRATADYLVHLEGKCPGSVSPAHVARGRYALNDLKRLMRDLPLSGIGYDELAALTDLLKSRPPTTRGEPMSADTVTTVLAYARRFFLWLEDSGRWTAPRRWER